MQIDLLKYMFKKGSYVELLDKHTTIEVPKGYKVIDARQRKKNKEKTKKSEL